MKLRTIALAILGALCVGGGVAAVVLASPRESGEVRAFLENLAAREGDARYKARRVLHAESQGKPVDVEFEVEQDGQGGRKIAYRRVSVDGKVMFDMERVPTEFGPWSGFDWTKGWPGGGGTSAAKRPLESTGLPWPWAGGLPGGLKAVKPSLAALHYTLVTRVGLEYLGRQVTEATLTPRRNDRPAYRILVDRESGIALRMEILPPGKSWKPAFSHSAADFSTKPSGLAKRPEMTRGTADLATLAQKTGVGVARPGYLPRGFQLLEAGEASQGVGKTVYLIYGDGLAVFHVFSSNRELWWKRFERGEETGSVPVARNRRGAWTEYGLKLEKTLVTVSGSLAESELEEVVRSLELER